MHFHIRVRDHFFWSQRGVREALSDALTFMTGDAEYSFHFEPGHSTAPTSLFDRPGFSIDTGTAAIEVTLFSGGLDSLSGALELLTSGQNKVVLVSHQSKTGTTKTQQALAGALEDRYPKRVLHYSFECTLRTVRAREETQRTRSFLYSSIAYAIASAYNQNAFSVYENGVTSVNLPRREDLANARASRTTHPQAMAKMAGLLSLIGEREFKITLPYMFNTKVEVFSGLKSHWPQLISSSVSCTRTFDVEGEASHCGRCLQCIDRRIAAYSAGVEEFDHRGLYTYDIIADPIKDPEARTTALDYIRQAISFAGGSVDKFEGEYLAELAEILDYLPEGGSDSDKVARLWTLFTEHGRNVKEGLSRMRLDEDVFKEIDRQSLLGMISDRQYLRPECARLTDTIASMIEPAISEMFAVNKPKDEPDLNAKLGALLRSHDKRIRSEHPTMSFACARVVPDHLLLDADVLIEAKYIRDGTPPSKATEGIAADLTKYPPRAFILFVIYDPRRMIRSDNTFRSDIESKGRNKVLITR
jgi:7-cyano-7-deazaguanine synthase in queuosine biosynthesis